MGITGRCNCPIQEKGDRYDVKLSPDGTYFAVASGVGTLVVSMSPQCYRFRYGKRNGD